jgi:putative copper resistance protein D
LTDLVQTVVLGFHLFSAVLFVGGSFFIWLVVEPVSHRLGLEEAARTRMIAQFARRFGSWSTPLLVVLIVTGLYNASWYLPSGKGLLTTPGGEVLLAKVVAVGLLVALIYVHGLYYGRKISALARAGDVVGLQKVRRVSRIISYANLGLMVVVLGLAALLQTVA